jgi:ketosteroid isomerase-like protein
MKNKLLIVVFAILLVAQYAVAQTKDEKAIAETVETLRNAMINADAAILDKIIAEELSYGHSGGNIENKKELIESLTSGKSDFITMDLTAQTIKVVGKTALVRHKLSAQTNNAGVASTINLFVLLVWQKQGGVWKLLARQAAKQPV